MAVILWVCFPFLAGPALANDLTTEIKDVDWVGFQQLEDASRVFVRTTEPIRYRIDKRGANKVVLVLENARIPQRNNRRLMDTRHFDSPVAAIQPRIIEGPSSTVNIVITMRRVVPYKPIQEDTYLAIEFQRIESE